MLWFLIVLAYLLFFLVPMIVSVAHMTQGKKTNWISRLIWLALGTLLLIGLIIYVNIYTEVQWFKELGYVARYWTVFWAKWEFFLLGLLVSFVFFLLNIKITRFGQDEELRKEKNVEMTYGTAYILSGLIALLIGLASITFWDRYLLYKNQVPFATADPIFGKNIAFYVFSLPFMRMIGNYLWGVILITLFGVAGIYAGVHYNQYDSVKKREILNRAITHCSVLGIIFVLIFIYTTRISIWNLMYSGRGAVFGAGWTDVHVQIGVYKIFIWILVLSGVMFLVSAFAKSLKLTVSAAVGAMATWFVFWLIVVLIVPAIIQHYKISPNELEYEKEYIQYNISLTREAYGLTDKHLRVEQFPVVTTDLTPELLAKNQVTINSTRIWDWRPLEATYQQTQSFRLYYYFVDVDILRYAVEGKLTQVMASTRELDQDKLASGSKTWQNTKLVYTHGYGICLNPVNRFTREGLPDYWIYDIPPTSKFPELKINRPEIYFGELTNNHIFVKTTHPEFDYPLGDTNATCFYQGTGGIEIGSGLRKLTFALRFDGIRLLTAKELKPESRIMFRRSLEERIPHLVPFLVFDHDPYQVVADGRIWFMWDAYTVSNDFPYSERYEGYLKEKQTFNYIRNSVKAIMDAYNGTVDFYVFDEQDPIIKAYQKIFPGMFKSKDQMPPSLRAHVRYPEDFMRIQAVKYSVYHMNNPNVFYNKEDVYDIANESYHGNVQQILPYYMVMALPGETKEEFIQMLPFTPHTTDPKNPKNNMVAWMCARADGEHYGELLVYEFPKDRLIFGPMQIEARINQNDVISKDFTLWNQQGSQVITANQLVVPLSNFHLIYVKPIYLQATVGKMPELKRVVVASGDKLAYAESFEAALQQLVGMGEFTTAETKVSEQSKLELIRLASQFYNNYLKLMGQHKVKEAAVAYEKLGEALNQLLKTEEEK